MSALHHVSVRQHNQQICFLVSSSCRLRRCVERLQVCQHTRVCRWPTVLVANWPILSSSSVVRLWPADGGELQDGWWILEFGNHWCSWWAVWAQRTAEFCGVLCVWCVLCVWVSVVCPVCVCVWCVLRVCVVCTVCVRCALCVWVWCVLCVCVCVVCPVCVSVVCVCVSVSYRSANSRRYILNIYSTNIHTEYFKHAA